MKFNKLIKTILKESPIAAFSTKEGLPVNIDLHIKDQYATNYEGFIDYIKNTMGKLQDPDSQNKFIEELKMNDEFKKCLEYFYQKRLEEFFADCGIN
jgi:hypothetical protein